MQVWFSKVSGKIKAKIKSIQKKSVALFVIIEKDKKRANLKSLGFLSFSLAFLCMIYFFIVSYDRDTSTIGQTDKDIALKSGLKESLNQENSVNKNVAGVFTTFVDSDGQKKRVNTSRNQNFEPTKFKAQQVIEREGSFEPDRTIPMGTNLIGQLLTSIDTRETEQFYKVFLPYGGKFRGGAEIPKGSTLFGKVKYSGKGKKVFMTFSKGVFPNGEEFEIQAQALNSKDYSPGINGDFHGKSGARLAATLGLSVISGATTVLTEREQFGNMGLSTPRATFKNAAIGGIAGAADNEAQRQAQSLSDEPEFVTIDAGKDLIVNLTGAYLKK